MTSTEAIVRIRQLQSDKSLCEALELAVDALKKSEPMSTEDGRCRVCQTKVFGNEAYCWHCGQRLSHV